MKFSVIDCSGKEIAQLKEIKEVLAWNNMYSNGVFTKGNKAFNEKGELLFRSPAKWNTLLPFNGDYTMFLDENDECGIINNKGEVVIRAKYNWGIRNIGKILLG